MQDFILSKAEGLNDILSIKLQIIKDTKKLDVQGTEQVFMLIFERESIESLDVPIHVASGFLLPCIFVVIYEKFIQSL